MGWRLLYHMEEGFCFRGIGLSACIGTRERDVSEVRDTQIIISFLSQTVGPWIGCDSCV